MATQMSDETTKAAVNSIPLPWGLVSMIKDFGIVVVLIWYLYFTQTNSIPNTQREFHELLVKEREVFRNELKTQRDHDEKRWKSVEDLTAEIRRSRNDKN